MDLQELDKKQLQDLATQTEDKEAMREIADHVGVTYSGNTGVQKLKENILEEIMAQMVAEEAEKDEPEIDEDLNLNDPVAQALIAQNKNKDVEDVHAKAETIKYSVAEMMEMDAAQVKDEKLRKPVIRTQALRLRRVRIVNNDPADASVPGTLVTVVSKYTGKVSKLIPHDEEVYVNGYHIPQIILDDLESRTYNVRREKKKSKFGVKERTTSRQKKFFIEYLPDLTKKELAALAQEQTARGAIDRSNQV